MCINLTTVRQKILPAVTHCRTLEKAKFLVQYHAVKQASFCVLHVMDNVDEATAYQQLVKELRQQQIFIRVDLYNLFYVDFISTLYYLYIAF